MSRLVIRSLLYLSLSAAAALVAVLSVQKRTLRAAAEECQLRAERPYPGFLVPAFRARTLAGDTVMVGATGPGDAQVLFFFTTTCPFCLETLPAWKRIAEEAQSIARGSFQAYGVSLSSEAETREYVRDHGLPFPVLFLPELRLEQLYRVLGLPLTVVLDSGGVMRHVRFGSLAESGMALDSVLCVARALVEAAEPCP